MTTDAVTPTASVIVSTYNAPRSLEAILHRLSGGSRRPQQIVIADDGSSEDTAAMIRSFEPPAGTRIKHCWHADEGFRKTRILNESVAHATGAYLAFLDGDCLPHPRWLEDHLALAESGAFVQGRRAFVPERFVEAVLDGRTTIPRLLRRGRLSGIFKAIRLPVPRIRRDRDLYGLLGCNLAMWREDVVRINGFDEAFEGWGIGEDSDLCVRLYNLGVERKMVHGRALVYHLDHPELPRDHVPESLARLQRSIDQGLTRCDIGLDRHATTIS